MTPPPDTAAYRAAVRHAECPGCKGAFSADDHTQQMRDWHDKPHRLVYDLTTEVDQLRETILQLEGTLRDIATVATTGTAHPDTFALDSLLTDIARRARSVTEVPENTA